MTSPREQFEAAKRANEGFFYPESAVWSDGVQRRFKVTDPNRSSADSPLKLTTSPLDASLRLVKFHPDDPQPQPGASVTSRNGLLVLGAYTDVGNLFGTRIGVGRIVDERLRTGISQIGAHIHQLTAPEWQAIYQVLGHDLHILYTPADSTWGTSAGTGGLDIAVRGLLMPAGAGKRQVAAGAGLPVPQFEAYLPFNVGDLSTPGWHIVHEGQHYYPTADARDEGGQGVVWIVALGSPGEVTGGKDQPDWTATTP